MTEKHAVNVPPQDLRKHCKDLRHQFNEHSFKIASRRNAEEDMKLQLQLTQKKTSQTEEMLEDQLEVGRTVHAFQSCLD